MKGSHLFDSLSLVQRSSELSSSDPRQVQPAVVVSRVSPPLLDKRLRVSPTSNQPPSWTTNLDLVEVLLVVTGKGWRVGEAPCKANLGKFPRVLYCEAVVLSIPTADQLRQTLICSAWGAGPICLW